MNADMAQLASLAHGQIALDSPTDTHHDGSTSGNKRKNDDGHQGSGKTRRSRYISLACNECKRRKIKCNGQSPCQRCGNLNLECVYAPNCCNGFKDSQEYREMSEQIASLQDQVNMLYDNLSNLRAQLGHVTAIPQQPQMQVQQQQQLPSSIDPSLQSQGYQQATFSGSQSSPGAPVASMSPSQSRPKSQSRNQPTFRGPTSPDFNFGVAKSSLQVLGLQSQADSVGDGGNDDMGEESGQHSPSGSSQRTSHGAQLHKTFHESKDPIWKISREEMMRLCEVYEDEMGLMYPVLDINKVTSYAEKLYRFLEAMRRSGLMQQGFPGADAVEDEDTNLLKLVLATALTVEASGRSELGKQLFECVQPAIDNILLGDVGVKGIRLLVMTAMYEFHRDNESTSWRIIGLTARLCIELGLHRRETYDAMTDESERSETLLLFWAIYVLDRRWSFGTGMPFALQDTDIDSSLPRPGDRSPYLTVMIKYCEIASKVWRTFVITSGGNNAGSINIDIEEMNYLDYQVLQWHRGVPPSLRFEHPSQQGQQFTPIDPPSSRAGHRLRIILYLRANSMRIQIYRRVLLSATSIMQHREQAQTVVDIAKDNVRVLTHVNQTSDLYRTQQVLFNPFLMNSLAVLFLAVSHVPALFANDVREEFYMALELVRGLSKDSFVSKRLWRTIRGLQEFASKLGLSSDEDNGNVHGRPHQQQQGKDEVDPSRSAAVAMAGLAGHNVDEMALFSNGDPAWNAQIASSGSPDHMANDLTSLFEAAGGLQAIGQDPNGAGSGHASIHYGNLQDNGGQGHNASIDGMFAASEGLSNVFKELF